MCCVLGLTIDFKIDETTLWYFFSTLAQSAAAFAALLSVFAVFRLQANVSNVAEKYRKATYWLTHTMGLRTIGEMPNERIKETLKNVKESPEKQQAASRLLDELERSEGLNSGLANTVALPLKLWGYIFLFSLALLPMAKVYAGSAGIAIILGFVVAAVIAVWKTKRFIQKCLETG